MEEDVEFITTFKDITRTAELQEEEDDIQRFIRKVYNELPSDMQNKTFPQIKKIPDLNYRNPILFAKALEIWDKKEFKKFIKEDLRFEEDKANIYRYLRLITKYF